MHQGCYSRFRLPMQRRSEPNLYAPSSASEKHFPLCVDDWDTSSTPAIWNRRSQREELFNIYIERKLFGVCASLQYFYRYTVHPDNCLRNREEDEILYYMTTMTVEETTSEDLAIGTKAAAWRNAVGLWPARVSSRKVDLRRRG